MTIESSISLKYMHNKISTSYVRTLRNNAFIDKCFIIVIKNVKKKRVGQETGLYRLI